MRNQIRSLNSNPTTAFDERSAAQSSTAELYGRLNGAPHKCQLVIFNTFSWGTKLFLKSLNIFWTCSYKKSFNFHSLSLVGFGLPSLLFKPVSTDSVVVSALCCCSSPTQPFVFPSSISRSDNVLNFSLCHENVHFSPSFGQQRNAIRKEMFTLVFGTCTTSI